MDTDNSSFVSKTQNIFLIKDVIFSKGDEKPVFIFLRHPRTFKQSLYLLDSTREKLHEVSKYSQDYRSWFIGDSVKSDGSFYFSTPIDPLMLVLPYLLKNEVLYSPLDQLLYDHEFKDTLHLLPLKGVNNRMHYIADQKGDKALNAWKFNEEKTMNWLKKKINRLIAVLKTKEIHVNPFLSISSNFVQSTSQAPSEDLYLRYAYGLISEYLTNDLCKKLKEFLNISDDDLFDKKRKAEEDDGDKLRKLKRDCMEKELVMDKIKPVKTPVRKSAREAALVKAASGTKNITSFFSKK